MDEDPFSDEELSKLAYAASQSDAGAAEALFCALLPRVRNLVRYLVRGDKDVDDLTQEALLAILRGMHSFRGEGAFRSWCDRVVARCVFGRRRGPVLTSLAEDSVSSETQSVEGDGHSPELFTLRRQLAGALDRLPEAQRDAVILHHVLGFSIPELASELAAPEETVRSRLRLGKASLKEFLEASARMVN